MILKMKEFHFVAISSNDIENYPQDAPHLMKKTATRMELSFSLFI